MHSNEWGLISLNVCLTKNGPKLHPCITPPSGCRTVAASVVCPRELNRVLHVPEGPALPSGAVLSTVSGSKRPAPSQVSFSQRGVVRKEEHETINPLFYKY